MNRKLLLLAGALSGMAVTASAQTVRSYVTLPDRSALYSESEEYEFSDVRDDRGGRSSYIVIDPRQSFQPVDGFGFALTGGSAEMLMRMSPEARAATLRDVFDPVKGAGVSCVRLTVGASDLNRFVFFYDDMPEGQEDFRLEHFSLSQDLRDVIPVMNEILEINPDICVLASPWSAPSWMKTVYDVRGGQLRKECYGVYADYLVCYVQEMEVHGITVNALTVQNEPLRSTNTPSMFWFAWEQADFVKNHLGPKFRKAGLDTKIIVFDHNCDRPDYALAIYDDPEAAQYVSGAAFHHYAGDMSAMTYVHEARPDKDILHRADDHRTPRNLPHRHRRIDQTTHCRPHAQLEPHRRAVEPGGRSPERSPHRQRRMSFLPGSADHRRRFGDPQPGLLCHCARLAVRSSRFGTHRLDSAGRPDGNARRGRTTSEGLSGTDHRTRRRGAQCGLPHARRKDRVDRGQ